MQNSHLQNIKNKLHKFQTKFFLNQLFKGIILFVFYSFISVFLFILIEYFFHLSSLSRKILFFSTIFLLVLFFILFISKPLFNLLGFFQSLSNEKASLLIGKYFPQIDDKLLNLLQLDSKNNQGDLLLASIDQKSKQLDSFTFSNAIDFKKNFKFFPLLFIPLFVLGILKLFHIDQPIQNSFVRIISYNKQFIPPTPFQVKLLSPNNIIYGQDYDFKIKLTGSKIPNQLYLLLSNHTQVSLLKDDDNIFSFHFNSIKNDLFLKLFAPPYHIDPFFVRVIHPPIILSNQVTLYYPKYLHKPSQTFSNKYSFSIPYGTKIKWNIKTSNTDSLFFKIDNTNLFSGQPDSITSISYSAFHSFDYSIKILNKFITQQSPFSYHVDVFNDEFPKIQVLTKTDTLLNKNYHQILGSDDHGLTALKLFYRNSHSTKWDYILLNKLNSDFLKFNYVFPDTLKLKKDETYEYYFALFDNDRLNHYKSVKSKLFVFNQLSEKKLNDLNLFQQEKNLNDLSKIRNKQKMNLQNLNNIKKSLFQKSNLDWRIQKKLDNQLKEQERQSLIFKQKLENFNKLINNLSKKNPNEYTKDLQKRLQEFEQSDRTQKLLDELNKIAKQLNKEDLLDKLKDLQNYSEHQEKSLERILELTKKYYLQQKLLRLSDKLDNLSKKQEFLSKKNDDTVQQQDSLLSNLKNIQKDLDSLSLKNKNLKSPIKLPITNPDVQDIKNDMQEAISKLKKKSSKSANSLQQKASNKMKQLANSLKKQMMDGAGEGNQEDIHTLQSLLKSLLNFSFRQESLLNSYSNSNIKNTDIYLINQNKQKLYFKYINDSLYTLALRNPKISQDILDLAYDIDNSLDRTLNALSDNKLYSAKQHGQFTLTSSNILADMFSNSLNSMKNAASMPGKGKGKGKSFSLPDIIKQQEQLGKNMKKALNKKNKGRKKGGKKSQGNSQQNESELQQQFKLYQQQQQIKSKLEQLTEKLKNKSDIEKIQNLIKKIDFLEKKLIKEGITQESLNKVLNIEYELLKLKNATFLQNHNNQRQSKSNTQKYNLPDTLFFYFKTNFLHETELLKRSQLPVKQYIKTKILNYISND